MTVSIITEYSKDLKKAFLKAREVIPSLMVKDVYQGTRWVIHNSDVLFDSNEVKEVNTKQAIAILKHIAKVGVNQ